MTMFIRKLIFVFSLVISAIFLHGQVTLLEIRATWDNDYSEWEIDYLPGTEEVVTGRLSRKWPMRDNWEEWSYDFGEYAGFIKTKWRGDLSKWELRGNNKVIDIGARWRNDLNEWQVTYQDKRIIVSTEYPGNANSWTVKSGRGSLVMFTAYRDDPRDWVVEDNLLEVEMEQKIAILFIGLFQSIPKS